MRTFVIVCSFVRPSLGRFNFCVDSNTQYIVCFKRYEKSFVSRFGFFLVSRLKFVIRHYRALTISGRGADGDDTHRGFVTLAATKGRCRK